VDLAFVSFGVPVFPSTFLGLRLLASNITIYTSPGCGHLSVLSIQTSRIVPILTDQTPILASNAKRKSDSESSNLTEYIDLLKIIAKSRVLVKNPMPKSKKTMPKCHQNHVLELLRTSSRLLLEPHFLPATTSQPVAANDRIMMGYGNSNMVIVMVIFCNIPILIVLWY